MGQGDGGRGATREANSGVTPGARRITTRKRRGHRCASRAGVDTGTVPPPARILPSVRKASVGSGGAIGTDQPLEEADAQDVHSVTDRPAGQFLAQRVHPRQHRVGRETARVHVAQRHADAAGLRAPTRRRPPAAGSAAPSRASRPRPHQSGPHGPGGMDRAVVAELQRGGQAHHHRVDSVETARCTRSGPSCSPAVTTPIPTARQARRSSTVASSHGRGRGR